MLELESLSAWYGGAAVLRDISLCVRPGELLAVIGPNGSGKSTLLRTAAGLHRRVSGAVRLDGTPLDRLSPKALARKVAWMPQSRNTPEIAVWRMVLHGRFPHMSYPRHVTDEDRRIVAQALEDADAAELSERFLRDLSGGERQKVYLAAALAQQSDYILMDEPTVWLDIAHQFQILTLAKRLSAEGKGVVMASHDLPLTFASADRIAVLRNGRIVRVGTPDELFPLRIVPEVFGVALRRVRDGAEWRYFCAANVTR